MPLIPALWKQRQGDLSLRFSYTQKLCLKKKKQHKKQPHYKSQLQRVGSVRVMGEGGRGVGKIHSSIKNKTKTAKKERSLWRKLYPYKQVLKNALCRWTWADEMTELPSETAATTLPAWTLHMDSFQLLKGDGKIAWPDGLENSTVLTCRYYSRAIYRANAVLWSSNNLLWVVKFQLPNGFLSVRRVMLTKKPRNNF